MCDTKTTPPPPPTYTDDSTTASPEPTESDAEKIKEKTIEIVDKVAHEIGIPMWGMVAIIIGVCIVVLGICFWCVRRCCRKRRGKDGKKGKGGVDLKSVQLLGSAYKEKVRVSLSCTVVKKMFACGTVFRCSQTWRSSPRTPRSRTRARARRAFRSWANYSIRYDRNC